MQGSDSINFSDILKSEYEFIALLGKKDNSELIRYRNKKLQRDMVVRKLPADVNAEVYRRLSQIRQDNLVQIFDVAAEQDYTYILEEYIDGICLAELVPLNAKGRKG